MKKILLVDDDVELLESHSRLISAHVQDVEIYTASDVSLALSRFQEKKPRLVLMDLSLEEVAGVESGYGLLAELRKLDSHVPIIVLTGHGDVKYGVRAIGEGANYFLEKPVNMEHLKVLLHECFRHEEFRTLYAELAQQQKRTVERQMVGGSDVMKQVRDSIAYAASHDLPVLITGETGTGKGLCAQCIHTLSSRSDKHYVRYQPASQSGDLIRSELFGHKKGAFTGADADRAGLIEQADGGTLFLDEIDEFPLETQVLLLGVLQEKKYRPVGVDDEKSVDFRLVCATNADVQKVIEEGRFRKDFYHRISHVEIELPPLRKRKEDISELIMGFLSQMQNTSQLFVSDVSKEVSTLLREYDWPGNVRELAAVIENGAHRAHYHGRSVIEKDDIQLRSAHRSSSSTTPDQDLTFHEQVAQFKQQVVLKALDDHDGNQAQTARALGIDRSTLIRIIK